MLSVWDMWDTMEANAFDLMTTHIFNEGQAIGRQCDQK